MSFPKKSQARQFATQAEHHKHQGLFVEPKRGAVTVRAYAEDWLERQLVGGSTYRNYESFLRIHLLPQLGHKTLAGVERADIERFVVALGTRLAASTVHDRVTLVRNLFKTAVEERRIAYSPVDGTKLPRVGTGAVDEDAIPSREEVDLIAWHIGPYYRLSVYLQAGAGLRVSEALAFATQCRRAGAIRVREQVSWTAHRADCRDRFGPLKHRIPGAYRDVPLPAFLEEEIDVHLRRWGVTPVGDRDVICARRGAAAGTMPTATTYGPHFRRAVWAAGLLGRDRAPKYTPRTLLHFFASTALAHGVPLHEVSRWLGHTSIKTTVDSYGHLVPAAWERCRQTLQQTLGPAPADRPAAERPAVAHRSARALDGDFGEH
ncbi:tyrosine-type recombinase/integrase [Streptantibioticus ferralitis]|uniref:Tyrosine-type recombinase/integrase n=1 Tax=Streptantibioticus ferralitis TaxID=236510 RepID=A0ABT5ZBH1_9ACTN|nr:tyrosine-type recombinase/integrase [Streptantibioticus ferralitis]MDF2261187.1 tyrosine-type recombinase/integrase [Streptantibioticus ferralitis]